MGRPRFGDPYAGVAGRRLFVAVPLPEDAAGTVAGIVDEVRAMPLPPGMRDVRWVRVDGLHLTLRFLGPTPDARIEPTAEAVARAATRIAPFTLAIEGVGTFPPGPRPRTLWLGLGEGLPALQAAAVDVRAALAAADWPDDAGAFRGHLTLARSDGLAAGPLVAARLAEVLAGRTIAASVDRLGLYESVTGGGPARYVPVGTFPLGGDAEPTPRVYHHG